MSLIFRESKRWTEKSGLEVDLIIIKFLFLYEAWGTMYKVILISNSLVEMIHLCYKYI